MFTAFGRKLRVVDATLGAGASNAHARLVEARVEDVGLMRSTVHQLRIGDVQRLVPGVVVLRQVLAGEGIGEAHAIQQAGEDQVPGAIVVAEHAAGQQLLTALPGQAGQHAIDGQGQAAHWPHGRH